jgi:hypothetical protein
MMRVTVFVAVIAPEEPFMGPFSNIFFKLMDGRYHRMPLSLQRN